MIDFKKYSSEIKKLSPQQRRIFYRELQRERNKEVKNRFKTEVLGKKPSAIQNFLKFRNQQQSYGKQTLPKSKPSRLKLKPSFITKKVQQANPYVVTNPSGYIPLGNLHKEADDAANLFP